MTTATNPQGKNRQLLPSIQARRNFPFVQLSLPGFSGRGEVLTLPRPLYRSGRKLTHKARWNLKIVGATGWHREQVATAIRQALAESETVAYSRTYLSDLSTITFYAMPCEAAMFHVESGKLECWIDPTKPEQLRNLYQNVETLLGLDNLRQTG